MTPLQFRKHFQHVGPVVEYIMKSNFKYMFKLIPFEVQVQYFPVLCSITLIFFIQWNLVIKRSDITKPSYNVSLLVPAVYIS